MESNTIITGDCLKELNKFPNEYIDCVVTSPPYWNLRDYGVEGQMGLEPSIDKFISSLCNVFDEIKRVLKPEGTCFVNLGDTYSGSGKGFGDKGVDRVNSKGRSREIKPPKYSIPSKSLCLIPHRFAIEMIARGWILRNTIIWHKPNCMPDSVKDRFTVDFEYVFFLVKSKKYFFNKQYEPVTGNTHSKGTGKSVRVPAGWDTGPGNHNKKIGRYIKNKESFTKSTSKVLNKRNKRSVWKIPTQANPSAHFATYPEKLCVTPILAGCPEGGIVLDPFFGSGTTGLVANKLGRRFIGIELNPEYVKIASDRLSQLSIF